MPLPTHRAVDGITRQYTFRDAQSPTKKSKIQKNISIDTVKSLSHRSTCETGFPARFILQDRFTNVWPATFRSSPSTRSSAMKVLYLATYGWASSHGIATSWKSLITLRVVCRQR